MAIYRNDTNNESRTEPDGNGDTGVTALSEPGSGQTGWGGQPDGGVRNPPNTARMAVRGSTWNTTIRGDDSEEPDEDARAPISTTMANSSGEVEP